MMTENKPIIDGVDVSECEYSSQIDLDVNIICISNFPSKKSGYCKDNTNCLFKQLARKTQECEELKKQLMDFMNGEYCANGCAKMQTQYKEYHCKLIKQIEKLKVKNKELKQSLEFAEGWKDMIVRERDQLKADINKKELIFAGIEVSNRELIKELNQLKASKEQAEQKLEKIKDRCNETLEIMNKDSGTNAYAGGRCTEAGQILHIIDEVE